MKYFSICTGVGGFELGIGDKGQCIGFSEIDKYCSQLLANKFPGIRNYGNCPEIDPATLPEFDMLVGGFPCQSFSIAGKRRGFEDTRGTLFFEIARICRAKRPKFIFLENVKGLLNHNKGETFRVILQTLEELGYRTQWMVLNSKFFGVPQNRERVFIIGSLRNECRPQILPFRTNDKKFITETYSTRESNAITATYHKGNKGQHIGYYQGDIIGKGHNSQENRVYMPDKIMGCLPNSNLVNKINIAVPVLTPDRVEKRQNGRRFKEDGDLAFKLTKTDIHGVMIQSHSPRCGDPNKGGTGPLISDEHCFTLDSTPHNDIMRCKIRRLTPTECERLQGFPDGWTEGFSDTQRYKMMGNAVTVNVIKAIMESWYGNTDKTIPQAA
jgi:DNA (cytosine-5)-methyltransferase 1